MKKIIILTSTLLLSASPVLLGAGRNVQVGAFAEGETVAPIDNKAPVASSRNFVKFVTPSDSSRASVDIPSTGTSGLIVWTIPMASVPGARRAGSGSESDVPKSQLRSPSGKVLAAESAESTDVRARRFAINDFSPEEFGLGVSRQQEVLHVDAAEPGIYTLDLAMPAHGAAYAVVTAEPDSPIALETWAAPLSRRSSDPISLHARIQNGTSGVAGGRVVAQLAPGNGPAMMSVDLFDDGKHQDGTANDGHFAAQIVSLPKGAPTGQWSVKFDASGTAGDTAFLRTGSSGFVSEPDHARLVAGNARAEAVESENGERFLRVSCVAQVEQPGTYRFDVLVGGDQNPDGSRAGVAWAESTETLATGRQTLSVDIPMNLVAGAARKGVNIDVRLLGLDPMGVAGRETIDFSLAQRGGQGAKVRE
ncbi:MAG: hypothetical protein L6R30_02655 [Thermoanaerobaculia bacterium]|nr:hypothetical protein [Thermoanaerobaculia bacterium]